MEIKFTKRTPNGIESGTILTIAERYGNEWIEKGFAVDANEKENVSASTELTSEPKPKAKKRK